MEQYIIDGLYDSVANTVDRPKKPTLRDSDKNDTDALSAHIKAIKEYDKLRSEYDLAALVMHNENHKIRDKFISDIKKHFGISDKTFKIYEAYLSDDDVYISQRLDFYTSIEACIDLFCSVTEQIKSEEN